MKFIKKASILIVILIFLLALSCSANNTKSTEDKGNTKTYKITAYNLLQEDKIMLNYFLNMEVVKDYYSYNTEEELLKDIIEYKFDLKNLDEKVRESVTKDFYYASEIISYSDTKCRFVEKNLEKEKFISADYIKIEQH